MDALHPEERFEAALEADIFTKEEAEFMREYEAVVLEMLTVDDFPFDEFARNKDTLIDHNPGLTEGIGVWIEDAGWQHPADTKS